MAYLWPTQRLSNASRNELPHQFVLLRKLHELLRQAFLRDQVLQLFLYAVDDRSFRGCMTRK